MTAAAAAAALGVACVDARQSARFEDLAGDERGPAKLGGWKRIALLLADAAQGTVHAPDTDVVVQAELAGAAAAAREAELCGSLPAPTSSSRCSPGRFRRCGRSVACGPR